MTERDHIYVGRTPGMWKWSADYDVISEWAGGEENVSIMHTRAHEYVLDLSTEYPRECSMNRRYDCGHGAYGPPRRLPSECPECNPTATDGGSNDTEWFIHRFECPDCDATTRADRVVNCYRCGSEMNHAERIGEVTDSVDTDTDNTDDIRTDGGDRLETIVATEDGIAIGSDAAPPAGVDEITEPTKAPVDSEAWIEIDFCEDCHSKERALRAIRMREGRRQKLCRPCFAEAVEEDRVDPEDPRYGQPTVSKDSRGETA